MTESALVKFGVAIEELIGVTKGQVQNLGPPWENLKEAFSRADPDEDENFFVIVSGIVAMSDRSGLSDPAKEFLDSVEQLLCGCRQAAG